VKLDRGTLCSDIMLKALEIEKGNLRAEDFWHWLTEIDLVIKPGDSSHSVLVSLKDALKDKDAYL